MRGRIIYGDGWPPQENLFCLLKICRFRTHWYMRVESQSTAHAEFRLRMEQWCGQLVNSWLFKRRQISTISNISTPRYELFKPLCTIYIIYCVNYYLYIIYINSILIKRLSELCIVYRYLRTENALLLERLEKSPWSGSIIEIWRNTRQSWKGIVSKLSQLSGIPTDNFLRHAATSTIGKS